jgi:hypothetical protein
VDDCLDTAVVVFAVAVAAAPPADAAASLRDVRTTLDFLRDNDRDDCKEDDDDDDDGDRSEEDAIVVACPHNLYAKFRPWAAITNAITVRHESHGTADDDDDDDDDDLAFRI